MSEPLRLYTTFHLNLAYSSIEEEQRAEVVRRCFWPLLRLARDLDLPFGIEAPAYTLEAAADADPAWLAELRDLTATGGCEFIGAGYAQVIAPLVPAQVNAANLRLGQERYEELLGFRPAIGLINEQAYSAGLPALYREAGFGAIIMEWDNPALTHPAWDPEWRYLPQVAVGSDGAEIPLLWNKSLAFQKFQRYVHGEMDLAEYLAYLGRHADADTPRAFNLYGNDIEIFDFRPGRYHTEAVLEDGVEWERIAELMRALKADDRFEFVAPSAVLGLMDAPKAGNRLSLECAEQPVPVKKQGKYNLTRWAVTPRDDLRINTACWRAYQGLASRPDVGDESWRELCYLWSSDFRTHITQKRWDAYLPRLEAFVERFADAGPSVADAAVSAPTCEVARDGRFVDLRTAGLHLRLNTRRGLAIESLTFAALDDAPVLGTIEHGHYDDISLGADFYTGHFVLEPPGSAKVTDLAPAEPVVTAGDGFTEVSAKIGTALGPFVKRLRVFHDDPRVEIVSEFPWERVSLGSFRIGHVTLLPEAFDRDSLWYATHNGGRALERFPLAGSSVDQGRPVSSMITATAGLGMTGGVVMFGDADKSVVVEVDKAAAALIGLMTYRDVRDSFFCRLAFSAQELDETGRLTDGTSCPRRVSVTIRPGDPL